MRSERGTYEEMVKTHDYAVANGWIVILSHDPTAEWDGDAYVLRIVGKCHERKLLKPS